MNSVTATHSMIPVEATQADLAEVAPQQPENGPSVQSGSFSQMLVDSGVLSREQMIDAKETAQREGLRLIRILVRDGLALSGDMAALIALHQGLPMLDLRGQTIDEDAPALLPEDLARRYEALPVRRDGDSLVLAVADPMDLSLLQDLAIRSGMPISLVVATREDILEHIDLAYRLKDEPSGGSSPEASRGKIGRGALKNPQPAQVIELLLEQAVQDRASDIHIDPTETRLRIRFRIDGILHDVANLPMEMHPMIVSRLKIMAGMNIAERRRAQDGQFTADVRGRVIDVRVASSGTVDGEMTVLRLLDKQLTPIGLDRLGMNRDMWGKFRKLLRLPYGLVVVCGPTGAGKSTTLYSSILQLDRIEQNVISLEDPVEYHIMNANQMQVQSEAGITFATQLRSILRLDPDVILIGEIRDQETAVIATQAALTGHLVLTSLHANDAVSALLRLRELGVAPYLIASSVAGILSQRMVRVVCNGCKSLTPRPAAEQEAYALATGEQRTDFVYGEGCNLCAHTGYRGRTGVFELLTMTDDLRQLFLSDAPRSALVEKAAEEGTVPLRNDGMRKVGEDETTPYEVMRVLFSLE